VIKDPGQSLKTLKDLRRDFQRGPSGNKHKAFTQ
jgi:hypothetical protein